jgi:hypothetical protein
MQDYNSIFYRLLAMSHELAYSAILPISAFRIRISAFHLTFVSFFPPSAFHLPNSI